MDQIAATLMACHGAQDTISREYNDALAKPIAMVKGHELKFLNQVKLYEVCDGYSAASFQELIILE